VIAPARFLARATRNTEQITDTIKAFFMDTSPKLISRGRDPLIQAILPEMGGARGKWRGISEDKMSAEAGL